MSANEGQPGWLAYFCSVNNASYSKKFRVTLITLLLLIYVFDKILSFRENIFETIIYLDSIFGGAYGSERENRLEKEYDLLIERKNHIDQAHFKWKQALIMVKQACSQLGLAVQKWKELSEIPEK